MKRLIVLSFYCFIVSSLIASPVFAAESECPSDYHCCPIESCYGESTATLRCHPPDSLCCESCTPPGEGGIINPVIGIFGTQPGEITIAYILATFLRLSLVVAGILLLIYLVIGGLQWLTSGGEKTAVAAARSKITNAFIGLILIVLVLVILAVIKEVFKLDILKPTLPTPE